MIQEHLPILQILVPLIAVPLCVLTRRDRAAYVIALIAAWVTFGISIALLRLVLEQGVQVYELGGWAVPWGIEYRLDTLGGFVLLFVSGLGAIVLAYSPQSVAREIPSGRRYLFYALYLLAVIGLLGIVITGDLFNLFVFLEISALPAYAMIALGKDRRSLTASFRYLVMGTIGATFILIGVGLLYLMTGTLNMADAAARIPVDGTRTVPVAFAFLTVGISLKMALFPLHGWLPNAYTYAPSVVTAFLAGTATKVSVYILLRFVFTVFGFEFSFESLNLTAILVPLAVMGTLVASTVAIFQNDIKRMLAYSSVAQIGYMVLGVSMASELGLTGGIVHLFNHALMKGGLFLAMGCIALRVGSVQLDDLAGLGRRMPLTMFAWVLGGLGLIGVPLTAGFVSKWYLVGAAMEHGWWPVAALILMSSLLALIYVWRVVEVAYFRESTERMDRVREAPLSMLIPTWVLIGATLFFGLWTSLSAGVAREAARALLGGLS